MLVVDDNLDVNELLSMYLAANGFEIARAYDGLQAIRSVLFFRPHIIVLNLQMPNLDGLGAMRYLRVHPASKDAKIIMTSGRVDFGPYALAAGADAFLAMPFPMHKLDAVITRLLAQA